MSFQETHNEKVYDYSDEIIESVWTLRNRGLIPSPQIEATEGEGVWSTGVHPVFRNILVSAIRNAREIICISAFFIGEIEIERALMDATVRGIRVYILSAPILLDRDVAIIDDDERIDERLEKYKAFLDRIAGKMLMRAANHFHSKFLLVDPKEPIHAKGYLSTANFNDALTKGLEIGVRLNPIELQGVYQQFVRGFWFEAAQELLRKGRLTPVSAPPGDLRTPFEVEGVLSTISSSSSDIKTLQVGIVAFLEQTEGPVYLSMYGFDAGHSLLKEIKKQAISRKIIILTPIRPQSHQISTLHELVDVGVVILGHRSLHAKAMVSKMNGEPVALVMTANLQRRGMDEGFETGVLLKGRRAERVEEILTLWMDKFTCIYKAKTKLGELLGPIWRSKDNRFIKETVENEKSIDGGVLSIKSLDIDPITKIPKKRERLNSEFFHRVKVSYRLRPPLLPAGVKSINSDELSLPLYKEGKQTYIVTKNDEEIQIAIQLKKRLYPNALIVSEGK